MSKYVPPHSLLKPERRYKSVIVLKKGPKYIVVQNRKTGNLTFPGGGCHSTNGKRTENMVNCALRELIEEAHNSIKVNKLNHLFTFNSNERFNNELEKNKKIRKIVTMQYNIFKANVIKNFNHIKRNFHKKPIKNLTKNEKETTNILLKSKNNLFGNRVMWNFMRNKVLTRLTPPPKKMSEHHSGRPSSGRW